MNRNLVNLIQAAVFVTVCALVGLALSRAPGAETVPAWIPTSIRALIGLAAMGLMMVFGRESTAAEREMDPRDKLAFTLGLANLTHFAKMHWRSFAPMWIFPVVFLYGGETSYAQRHFNIFFWLVALPVFFWSFSRATTLWREGRSNYPQVAFWAGIVPFLIWVMAVYSRLFILRVS